MDARASDAREHLVRFEQSLRGHGLDLVSWCDLAMLREEFEHLGLPLPARLRPLGVLVGNTRAAWPAFLATVRGSETLRAEQHPLDTWVENCTTNALEAAGVAATSYFAHRPQPFGYLPLQHWAEALGLLVLSPSHLSVHRDYGPWLALRALVVFDAEADLEIVPTHVSEPCASCAKPCRPVFEAAAEVSAAAGARRVTNHWQEWLRVRDACPVGRQYRYSDEQIRYHYARDRSVLEP